MTDANDAFDLDVSNDPEVERLGANASVQYAIQFWEQLSQAARRDGLVYDPIWNQHNVINTDDNGDATSTSSSSSSNQGKYTREILLTQSMEMDTRLYHRFRSNFGPYWNVESIPMTTTTSSSTTATGSDAAILQQVDDEEEDIAAIVQANSNGNNKKNNPLTGERWTSLLLSCDGMIMDYNFVTLLRANCHDMFWITETTSCTDLCIVPRAQFILIELARCREGYYNHQFRQQLQVFDIKTYCEELYTSVTNMVRRMKHNDNNMNGYDNGNTTINTTTTTTTSSPMEETNNSTLVASIRKSLYNLQTHWPYPSLYTLRQTQAVSTLKHILSLLSSTQLRSATTMTCAATTTTIEWITTACQNQLQQWHDIIALGKLSRELLHSSSQSNAIVLSALQRATKTFALSNHNNNASTMGDKHNASKMTASSSAGQRQPHKTSTSYITKTTSQLSKLMIHAKTVSDRSTLFSSMDDSQRASPSAPTSKQPASSSSSRRIFSDYGVVVWRDYCSCDTVTACRQQGERALQQLQEEQLTPRGLVVDGAETFDFVEVRQRPGHRVDNRYKILSDPTSPIAVLGRQLLLDISRQILEEDADTWRLLYGGIVHAFPRHSPDDPAPPPQLWHRDGPSLFPTTSDDNHHHPTHCFNVFIPLVDVSYENGATEFVPGTHEDARYDAVAADVILKTTTSRQAPNDDTDNNSSSSDEASVVRIDCAAGSAIVFDIRVMHRGLSNQSAADRPMLYFTFCRDWFQEQHMFQKSQSLLQASPLEAYQKLCRQLYHTVAGKSLLESETTSASSYGHPHYTTRFDLLLLEAFEEPSQDANANALQSANAVLQFANLSDEEKSSVCESFVRQLQSDQAWERKRKTLEGVRRARKNNETEEQDFTSIETDMNDVTALYALTAQLLFGETTGCLSQFGFPQNESGVCIALAVLKCSAAVSASSTITVAHLEESFSSWWNGAASNSRFQLVPLSVQDASNELSRDKKKLLVVFSSLGSGIVRPEWQGTLRAIGVPTMRDVDVLHVMDFSSSWYCQDPTCQWNGGSYYYEELQKRTHQYRTVFFLGDSMGAAGALRFASFADYVLAFTPQVDVSAYEAVTRADFDLSKRNQLRDEIVDAVKGSQTAITIHFGGNCEEDVQQVKLLPKRDRLTLVEHDYDDHILSLHLRNQGTLTDLVRSAMTEFLRL